MNKNTIDAYHKITAPKGLRERIEANVLAEQKVRSAGRDRWWKEIRVPAATVLAAAAICLIIWAGGAGMDRQDGEQPGVEMRIGETPEIMVISENGEVLGISETVLAVHSGETSDLNEMLGQPYGVAPAEMLNGTETQTEADGRERAVVLQVSITGPTTFRTDSEALSVYKVNEMLWTEPCSELILETDGELGVLLSTVGDGEVFDIEISSGETQSKITIVYDETSGRYLASCQEITGE